MKHETSRNLVWYFMRSKHWKNWEIEKTLNYMYLMENDPERAALMLYKGNNTSNNGPLRFGVKIFDYIYDMYDCVIESPLKSSTKKRLGDELTDLITYHENMGTIDEVV